MGETHFLHLSDIHFRLRKHETLDLDKDLRTQLIADAGVVVNQLTGPVKGILVTGDLAYSGKKEQYDNVAAWLKELSAVLGCGPEQVWVVPGNHDVDRDVIQNSTTLRDIREKLRNVPPEDLDWRLGEYLEDAQAGPMLLEPLLHYNSFAARYGRMSGDNLVGCTTSHDGLYWQDVVEVEGGYQIRLVGANSAVISDANDNDENCKLVCGTHQLKATLEDGVLNLLLCHHPPDWIRDADSIEDLLSNRFHVQLFGHKHVQRMRTIDGKLRLSSGAAQPSRGERAWSPCYNFLSINFQIPDGKASVKVRQRNWDESTQSFAPRFRPSGEDFFEYNFEVGVPVQQEELSAVESDRETTEDPVSDAEPQLDVRKLVFDFYELPFHRRLELGNRLGLLRGDDEDCSGFDLSRVILHRAKSEGLFERLRDSIDHLDI